MRFLVFRTSDPPRECASVQQCVWPPDAPIEGAVLVDYMHRTDYGGFEPYPAKGWAVAVETLDELLAIADAPREQNPGELIVRRYGGQPALEIYDGYRE